MQRFTKGIAAIMLLLAVVSVSGCENGSSGDSKESEQSSEKKADPLFGSCEGHEWVDLGLPSGTLWATCNIGANKPEDYGDYFAWGETETKDTYNWETYKHANGNWNKLTKYCNDSDYGYNCFTDNLTTLQASDDPATANWGNGWYTPTMEQWKELCFYTSNLWTEQNGVRGVIFTSKNGKTLFLPAAGIRWDSELFDGGSDGGYWSRLLYTDYPDGALSLGFSSDGCGMCDSNRYGGFSVRPVREK